MKKRCEIKNVKFMHVCVCVCVHTQTYTNPHGVLFSGGYGSSASLKIKKFKDYYVSWSPSKSQEQGPFSRE